MMEVNECPYYRDIPCGGDILKIHYLAETYGIRTKKHHLLGALFFNG